MSEETGNPRKVIYSSSFGSGWSSWNRGIPTRFICEWEPLIEYIEEHGGDSLNEGSVIIREFAKLCKEKFGVELYFGDTSLAVFTVPEGDRYYIAEYDGKETVWLESEERIKWN